MAYLLIAMIPAGLVVVYAIFRWRYQLAIRNAIYGSDNTALDAASVREPQRIPLALTFSEPSSRAEPPSVELSRALEIAREFRRRLVAAGAVFLVGFAIVVYVGQLPSQSTPAAIGLAYFATLPSLFVIAAFSRLTWRGWVGAGAGWLVVGIALLAGPLRVPWRLVPLVCYGGVGFASYGLVAVMLLFLPGIRSLIIGFLPLIGSWLALAGVLFTTLGALGVNLDVAPTLGNPALAIPAGVAGLLGIGAGVREIRRGVRAGFVIVMLAILTAVLSSLVRAPGLIVAIVGAVAFHALLTLAFWYLIAQFLRLKTKGLVSDDVVHFGLCLVALTTLLPGYASGTFQALGVPMLPLAASLITLVALLTLWRRTLPRRALKRMLLLRVFRGSAIRSRLVDLLDDSWRRAGTVDLVVGVDLAMRTLSAAALENFLTGRVDRQFVRTTDEIDRRLAELPSDVAIDGQYPLNELHCLPGVWPNVVSALAARADVVLMDLREFQASNRGAAYELLLVLRAVPLSRIVLVTDARTDVPALTSALQRSWSQLPGDAVNEVATQPTLDLLRCTGIRAIDAREILKRVFTAAFSPA